PLDNYILPVTAAKKRRNLTINRIKQIIKPRPNFNSEQTAKDMFLLSFMLCGMNSRDAYVYLNNPKIRGCIEYRRSKVLERKDGGLININIPAIAEPLIQKYGGEIQKRFSNNRNFNHSLGTAWVSLSVDPGFKCSMYYAR